MPFDDIGPWSEIKLEIIRKYAAAYSAILTRRRGFHHVYIDAFAGAGIHVTRSTGEYVAGSPLNALLVQPPFKEYFLIDLAPDKVASLRGFVGERPDVHILPGDCNTLLLDEVFPQVRWADYRRGPCLLDRPSRFRSSRVHVFSWDLDQAGSRSLTMFSAFTGLARPLTARSPTSSISRSSSTSGRSRGEIRIWPGLASPQRRAARLVTVPMAP